ncbi:TPA: DUF1378 family protein [Escherichia coli]|nr:DUF1378 family protein [Escherichia coli]
MTFIQLILLYFCTVVCVLYLVSGGYKAIRNYIRRKIDDAAAEKLSKTAQAPSSPNDPTRSDNGAIYLQKENIHARD